MKKLILAMSAACALVLTSCGAFKSANYTATTLGVESGIVSATVADLQVGERVTFHYTPTEDVRNAGVDVCKNAAIQGLLKENGNADVLVSPEFKYDSDLKSIEVSGRPANYKNFRSAN